MKKFYLAILLLCSSFLSFSQDEVELFGEWFLHYRTDNGEVLFPPLTDQEDYNIVLNFRLLPPTANDPFIIESYGPTSDTFEGKFFVENGTMDVFNVNDILSTCEHPPEVCMYFSEYNNKILLDPDTSVIFEEYIVSYEVTGTDDDTTLTITNDFSGNYAVYGRQTLSTPSFENRTITISPTIAEDVLNISNFISNSYFSIYSIDGKLILGNSKLSKVIDVSYLKSGLYFLKIEGKKTIKFIKQ